jgi:hypothetical protein
MIDLVDSTGYYPEGGEGLGKEAKRRHNEISHHIFKQFNQEAESPKGDGFLFWGKDPIQTCLASIAVIKRIKTEVIQNSTENKRYNMATKIVLTKGLIKSKEDEKDLTHGQAAHKCQRVMEAAWQKHHTVLIDSTVFDEIKSHLSETDIIYSGPYKLQVEEFDEIEVYQISDKELGLIVDPTRIKLQNKVKILVKNKVEEELEVRIKKIKKDIEKSTRVKIITMSVLIAILASSLALVLTVYPGSNGNIVLQNDIEFTIMKIQDESRDIALMIYESSKNEIMKEPLLATHTENYPIMIPENYPQEKTRIDLIKTVVDGMDNLYYLFVIPPETWDDSLQCRLYVIYPVGALIPGEAPDFLQKRDWCQNKANFEMYLSSAYYSRGQKEIVTTMIIPIFDDNLQKSSYLAGAINFNKILKDSIEDSKTENLGYLLVDHDNCIVASTYKTDGTVGYIVHFRELYNFNSGKIELASSEVSCKNTDSDLNPQGKIQMMFDEHSKFNEWEYDTIYLNQPEITNSDIDTNNFLENWKLIVIKP